VKKVKISNGEIEKLSNANQYPFPKYATQILNLLNSNAQGTRPAVVGQMSELIQEFNGKTLEEWIEWYSAKQPDAVTKATDKIYNMYKLTQVSDLEFKLLWQVPETRRVVCCPE